MGPAERVAAIGRARHQLLFGILRVLLACVFQMPGIIIVIHFQPSPVRNTEKRTRLWKYAIDVAGLNDHMPTKENVAEATSRVSIKHSVSPALNPPKRRKDHVSPAANVIG